MCSAGQVGVYNHITIISTEFTMKIEVDNHIITSEGYELGFVDVIVPEDAEGIHISDLYTAAKAFYDEYIRSLERDKLL